MAINKTAKIQEEKNYGTGIGKRSWWYALKEEVKKYLDSRGVAYHDFGCHSTDSCDYPVFGKMVGEAVASGEYERGLLFCGTGIGHFDRRQ